MVAHVIAIESTSKLQLAGSQDDIDAKRADIDLTMTAGNSCVENAEGGYRLPVRRNAGILHSEAVFDGHGQGSLAGESSTEASSDP